MDLYIIIKILDKIVGFFQKRKQKSLTFEQELNGINWKPYTGQVSKVNLSKQGKAKRIYLDNYCNKENCPHYYNPKKPNCGLDCFANHVIILNTFRGLKK